MKQLLTKTKLISVFFLALFLGCENNDNELLPEILSSFTFIIDEDTGTVEFINLSEKASSYSWDFGDGTASVEINPIKVYGSSGTYNVVLTVTNSAGATSTFETEVTVNIPEPPTPLALPIDFDGTDVDYGVVVGDNIGFSVVANPENGNGNDTNVGQLETGGGQFQNVQFPLAPAVDFSGANKTIQLELFSSAQIAVLVKFEDGAGARDVEVGATHTGSGWETLSFDFATDAVASFIEGDPQNGQSIVPDGQFGKLILFIGFNTDPGVEGTFYVDNVEQTSSGGGSGDTTPPVITLVGNANVALNVGDTYTEEGATATDDVDGDISGNIVIGGDTVDTDNEGTYTVTYNVSDAAGNAATEVTRTVTVGAPFDSGLLTNGDFESGADPWIQGVDDSSPAPVVTEMGNTFYQVNITTPDPGQPFLVNLSQKLEIVQDETYTLTFDAWSDTNRSIIAGIGLSGGSFANTTQTVDLTTSQQTFVLELTASGFGALDARVLFDVNGEAGLVNIDNVSLVLGGSGGGGDTTPPVITLSGDAMIDLIQNDPFSDPGASALDDTDGDISGNITVGGDVVDTSMIGSYVITYDVSDAAGNAATQVTRTVNVAAFDSGLLTNGDFESGAAPWIQGVDDMNPAPVVTEMGNTFYQTNVTTPDPGQPFLVNVSQKLEIVQDAMYILTFDAWSDTDRSIIAGIGLSGGSFANTTQTVDINTTRQTYSLMLTATGFGALDARVLFDLNGEAGLVNIDNVSLVLDSMGGGGGCTGGPTGDVNAFPVDFENCEGFFVSFGDDQSRAIVDNPVSGGINTSDKVYEFIKLAGGSGFGGFQNIFDTGSFTNNSTITFKIYSTQPNQEVRLEIVAIPNPGGTIGNPAPYAQTLVTANQWVEMSFDLSVNAFPNSGDETVYTMLVVKPGNVDPGTTPADVTFYIDDFAITPN